MNAVQAANDAVFGLVQATFPTVNVVRNPEGGQPPVAPGSDGLGLAIAVFDDVTPQRHGFLSGGIWELEITPTVMFAYRGDPGPRNEARWDEIETLKSALDRDQGGDPTISGTVEWARLLPPVDAELDRTKWRAGGAAVPVSILFSAPSEAG